MDTPSPTKANPAEVGQAPTALAFGAVGISPHPGGLASVLVKAGKRAKNTALEHADEAVWTLVGLMRGARSEKIRHDAAVSILDRAIGRPAPSNELEDDELESLRRVTDDAVDAILDSE